MTQQLKALGYLLAVAERELNLAATQINKATLSPLAIYPWILSELGRKTDSPLASKAIAALDARKGIPAMLTAPQQSILLAEYYATKDRLPAEELRVRIGHQLREIRLSRGLSDTEVAEMCGLSRSHIYRIESGRYNVTMDTLARLCNVLDVTIDIR